MISFLSEYTQAFGIHHPGQTTTSAGSCKGVFIHKNLYIPLIHHQASQHTSNLTPLFIYFFFSHFLCVRDKIIQSDSPCLRIT